MEFALSAGAVGDFISIAALIKDIIVALDDSRGSAKQYRDLVQQLNTLDQTLDTVQQTLKDPRMTHSLELISAIVLDTVTKTKKCLVDFLDQISKYEPALSTTASVKKASLNGVSKKGPVESEEQLQEDSVEAERERYRQIPRRGGGIHYSA